MTTETTPARTDDEIVATCDVCHRPVRRKDLVRIPEPDIPADTVHEACLEECPAPDPYRGIRA